VGGFFRFLSIWCVSPPGGAGGAGFFFFCRGGETTRAPFDLPEAENELVAGYHTEYSSMKFAVFFMGEYAAMFTWSVIFSTIFFGGFHLLPISGKWMAEQYPSASGIWNFIDYWNGNSWLAPIYTIIKGLGGICIYVWLRATMPRLRYDQLMSLGWKTLLPLATANLMVVALWILLSRLYPEQPYVPLVSSILAGAILVVLYKAFVAARGETKEEKHFEPRKIRLIETPAQRPVIPAVEGEAQ